MLMLWKKYGIKFVRLHKENFLSRFCSILMDMKCDVLLRGRNINSNVVLKKYLYLKMMKQVGSSGCCITSMCDLYKSPVVVS